MSEAIQRQSAEVIEAARRAGLPPEDDVAVLLARITSLAETVSATATQRQEDAEQAMFGAGLVLAVSLRSGSSAARRWRSAPLAS